MDFYRASVPHFKNTLSNLERWLDRAVAHAEQKKFDPNLFMTARLAIDQFAFVRQVGTTCDTAKFTCARLTGKDAPKHADDQKTIDELRTRIASVKDYLDTFSPADFEGTAERTIKPPPLGGKVLPAFAYLFEMQLPNFYFHATSAYQILRHSGVALGKDDYLPIVSARDP
jgi:uncharacterized protein